MKKQISILQVLLAGAVVLALNTGAQGAARVLTLEAFVRESCQNDSNFQSILMEELQLKYAKVLGLPAGDLMLSVGAEYGVAFDGSQLPVLEASLSRVFPTKGSYIDLRYANTPRAGEHVNTLSLEYGVDVARNAFGRSFPWLDKIIGLETEVARYQIVEAYEDYLASLMAIYYRWVAAYESVKAAKAAVEEGQKLVDNIQNKKKNFIAYQVDVDKAEYQLLGKQERLEEAGKNFTGFSLEISRAIRFTSGDSLLPDSTAVLPGDLPNLQTTMAAYDSTIRSGQMLRLLALKDSVALLQAADDLLPSLKPYGGISLGDGRPGFLENSKAYIGLQYDFNFDKTKEKAREKVVKIEAAQRSLASATTQTDLLTRFKDLHQEMESQLRSIELAKKKLTLAEAIHKSETTEYLYGRADINDLIQALNTLQQNRFDKISQEIALNILLVEWKRLTDTLVEKKDLEKTPRIEVE